MGFMGLTADPIPPKVLMGEDLETPEISGVKKGLKGEPAEPTEAVEALGV